MNQLQATLPTRRGPASLSPTARTELNGRAARTSPQVYAKTAGVISAATLAPPVPTLASSAGSLASNE